MQIDEDERRRSEDGIRRTIAIYAQLIDSRRLDEWSELFTEDARFGVYGEVHEGREVILREIGGMQPPPDRPVKHVCLTPVIELEGPDRARAWTDFTAFGTGEDGAIAIATIGRYHDELVREGDRWRFVSRTIVMGHETVPEGVVPSPPC